MLLVVLLFILLFSKPVDSPFPLKEKKKKTLFVLNHEMKAQMFEPVSRPWRHHVTQSAHRRECSRAGLRAVKGELSAWNAVVLKRAWNTTVSFPRPCFPSTLSTDSVETLWTLQSFVSCLNLARGTWGEVTVSANCFTCQRQADKEQRLSHVVSQASLLGD